MTNLPATPEPALSARETAELAIALLQDAQLRQAHEILARHLRQEVRRELTRVEALFLEWSEAGRPGDFFGWSHGRKTRGEVEAEKGRENGEARGNGAARGTHDQSA